MDDTDFFRQVTLRICGSLNIEKALFDTYEYLCRLMPVDEVSYTHFVPDMGAIQFVACATKEGGRNLGLTPMPMPRSLVEWMKQDIPVKGYYVLNHPNDHPLSRVLTQFRGMDENTSILVLRLLMENKFLGSFNMACAGTGRYTGAHTKLLSAAKEPLAIALSNHLKHREVIALKELKEQDNQYLKSELNRRVSNTIIGDDFGLKGVMTQVRQVAGEKSPVLLLGETGTGKEVIAAALHNLSSRSTGPFVTINCGAIPEGLVDSELFGHEKGAFTGAVSRYRGRFERAHKGTIFLDEIGELPLQAQVRLLRVLQEHRIERVGSTQTIKVDNRVIAATHRDLEDMASKGTFRQDLLYRLKVFPIRLPPLRDRPSDIPALAQHFLQKKGQELGMGHPPKIGQDFLNQLLSYHWPGNVRELENFIERKLIVNRGAAMLPGKDPDTQKDLTCVQPGQDDDRVLLSLDQAIKRHIEKAMELCGGRIEGRDGLAERLDIKPNTLRARMKKLDIPFGRKR